MFVRTATRRNKDGTAVRYLQLVHNEWDPAAKAAKMRVLHNFGREDQVDKAAIERLTGSLCRLLDPGRAAALREPGLAYAGSVAYGGPWLLDQLWQRLGIGALMTAKLAKTRRDAVAERVLFALVANRALDPSSKLAAAHWAGRKAHIEGLPATTDDACYRAMDWLMQVRDALEREVFAQVANLLNLEVDLLFFDTTSTYFERDAEDEPVPRDKHGHVTGDEQQAAGGRPGGFRAYGHSKDHRDDLPQIVIGMAVTRDGIPVRVWCWPGDTADATLIRQVKDEMRDWTLSQIVWVADRGFASAGNRRFLRSGDHHYILGEKLRSGSAEADAALSRQGRYQEVAANLRVKEVRLAEHERFVICYNPEAAERAAPHRRRRRQGRGEPRRQAPAPDFGPHAARGGHRPGLQAAPGSRARLARPQAGHRPAPGLPPQGAAHPRPRHLVLARPAAHPDRRDHHRHHLGHDRRRTGPAHPRHVHRPGRHVPADRRTHQNPARPARQAQDRAPDEDHRSCHRRGFLTSSNTTG